MAVAIVLHRDFPQGGLQRDARALAAELARRGHRVTMVSREATGDAPNGVERRMVPVRGSSNHSRDLAFAAAYRRAIDEDTLVVGFDKLPGLDLYFAADLCWKDRAGFLRSMTPRGQARLLLEQQVFDSRRGPQIAVLTAVQRDRYAEVYGLPTERFLLLPPLRDGAYRPGADPARQRREAREALGLAESDRVALFVGRDAQLKGLDRVLTAIATLGDEAPFLLFVGEATASHRKQAAKLASPERVRLLNNQDLAAAYSAADLLLHPARREAGGKVIAEALGCGMAVICTEVCGYATLVAESGAGAVLPAPFRQDDLTEALRQALRHGRIDRWRERARQASPSLFAREPIPCLADAIESMASRRRAPRTGDGLSGETSGLVLTASARCLLPPIADGLDWLLTLSGDTRRREAGRETIALRLAGREVYLKRHRGVGWGEIAKNWIALKPAVIGAGQEWKALKRLSSLGLAAPLPLAYGERGGSPARRNSALLMTALPPGRAVEDRLQYQPPITAAERWALARDLGLLVRRLHAAGIAHRDLYICHVFRLETGELALLDLHRALQRGSLSRRWRAKDLAALFHSLLPYGLRRRDRLRFLAAYHALPLRHAARRFAGLWQEVERRVTRLQARETRRLSG